ncbi:hypothetical protein BD626DRAFT_509140, partial [Schizophyllum amplum]
MCELQPCTLAFLRAFWACSEPVAGRGTYWRTCNTRLENYICKGGSIKPTKETMDGASGSCSCNSGRRRGPVLSLDTTILELSNNGKQICA